MTTKLTLSINAEVIEAAKRVSKRRGKSLSKLIEDYLRSLNRSEEQQESIVDKLPKLVQDAIKIPIPQDYKQFIREARYNDLKAKPKRSTRK